MVGGWWLGVGTSRGNVRGLMTASKPANFIGRVTRRLIPFAFICYVVAYIDRVNIGFAAADLQRDLGLSDRHTASAPASSFSATACSRSRAT